MFLEYLNHLGNDLMVANAARVSFGKWKTELDQSDEKLIAYLAKHNHWTPFAHPQLQIRVTAPIFLANQLKRHTVGLSLNEVSRRYVDDPPEFYTPSEWRGRPDGSIKQGSDGPLPLSTQDIVRWKYLDAVRVAKNTYSLMLAEGVAPEMARMVLPQSMMTQWIWTGSLAAFLRIYTQRIDSHAQLESQMFAKELGEVLDCYWPVCFKAWKGLKNEANS